MAISEIEKLERRYAENPHGLTFAPLAEIHRKNGDVAKALELLGPGLVLHPDYIPASIVLGRCHLDLGDQHAAEGAFTHVLSLDGENVIALKALADITERLLRLDDAERWLHTLLSIDRSNDEARDQLERVQTSRRQAEMASSAAPDTGAGAEAAGADTVETPVEAFDTEAGMAWVSDSDAPSSEETVPLAFDDLQPEPSNELTEPVEPLTGLVGRNLEGIVAEQLPDLEPFGGSGSDEFHVETSEDIILQSSGASEFQMPDAAEELFGTVAPPPPPLPPTPDPEPVQELEAVAEMAPEPEPVAQAVHEPEPEPQPQADPMITETMAELLLTQGHREEAILVFRELETRAGGDSRLRHRIAELEELRPAPIPTRKYAAGETGGRSTGDFLRAMVGSRPPQMAPGAPVRAEAARAGSASDTGGAPTRPAHDTLSLSSVFGEDGTPTRPAVPASGSAPSGGVSFDEFFNAPPPGGSPRPQRSPDPKSDDLDQFHTWLQNLKR
ncbi:MAG: tetratricopeptide repeat protein [Gemmatimonadales bacterium]